MQLLRNLRTTALLLAAVICAGCGGSTAESEAPIATAAPAATMARSTAAPSTGAAAVDPVLQAAKTACIAGEGYGKALSAFVASGTGPTTVAELAPVKSALTALAAELSGVDRPGADQLRQAVAIYTRANMGYDVLYGRGETAYQPVKAAGNDVDVLGPQAEEAWGAGAARMFGTQAPSAPSIPTPGRSC